MDPIWPSFTTRMITNPNATVIPIYFEGHTSQLFKITSHLYYTLRMGLLVNEFRQCVDGPVSISKGNPIDPTEISQRSKDARILIQFLGNKHMSSLSAQSTLSQMALSLNSGIRLYNCIIKLMPMSVKQYKNKMRLWHLN